MLSCFFIIFFLFQKEPFFKNPYDIIVNLLNKSEKNIDSFRGIWGYLMNDSQREPISRTFQPIRKSLMTRGIDLLIYTVYFPQ